jgi:hypothetical protein
MGDVESRSSLRLCVYLKGCHCATARISERSQQRFRGGVATTPKTGEALRFGAASPSLSCLGNEDQCNRAA